MLVLYGLLLSFSGIRMLVLGLKELGNLNLLLSPLFSVFCQQPNGICV